MASNRSNLALDEQSFQGLLAAAFTIQEHNDRANAGRQFPDTEGNALPKPEPPKCSQCGAQMASTDASCPTCSDATLRPGERLQRNWASMWLMSQDLNLTSSPSVGEKEGPPLSPADPGRPRSKPTEPNRIVPTIRAQARPVNQPYPQSSNGNLDHSDAPDKGCYQDSPDHNSNLDLAYESQSPLAAWPVGTAVNVESDDSSNAHSDTETSEALTTVEESLPEGEASTDSDPTGSEEIETPPPASQGLRVKLRFQRADLYLGLAVLVLAAALFWPAGASREPKLPTWERILIAIGIAEEAPPAVHYHGDPDLKVWVDTHTALYYCPGDELYGKSPGGHYSTQRDAQSDRFEPAERSVCVE